MREEKLGRVGYLSTVMARRVLCDNCEQETAIWKCRSCVTQNMYCESCRDLHQKIKAFRTHTQYEKIIEEPLETVCSNCENGPAKFVCQQCLDKNERYFCLGCSLFHNKIKAFRNHSLNSLSNLDYSANSRRMSKGGLLELLNPLLADATCHFDSVRLFFNDLCDGKAEASWQFKVLVTIAAVVAFLLCKYLFGSSSLVVNMGAVAGIYFYLQKRKDQDLESKRNLLQDNLFGSKASSKPALSTSKDGIIQQRPFSSMNKKMDLDEFETEFPNEFPYELHGKQASLRKRGRPYHPRHAASKLADSQSPEKDLKQTRDWSNIDDTEDMIAPSKAKRNLALKVKLMQEETM